MTISVIIVSYNTCAMTLTCLRTLYENLGGMSAEVWVVDNASSDDSVTAIQRDFPDVHIIANDTNRGFGAANNRAIQRSTGDYLLLLNSDAFIKLRSIQALVACMQDNPSAGVVGPKLLNEDGSLQRSCYRYPTPFRALCESLFITASFPRSKLVGDYRAWPHDSELPVDFVIGACMLVRRSALAQVGLFDERFFLYAEETDWCLRFHKAGWKILFTPQAEVVHLIQGSGKAQSERVFNEFRHANETFINKHYGAPGLWLYRVSQIIGAGARLVLLGTLGLLGVTRRIDPHHSAAEWRRILSWNLGFRGPRLRSP